MDSAFTTAKYPGYTTEQLRQWIANGEGNEVMVSEVERRERVAQGDRSVMTSGERLRFAKTGKAR